MVSWQAFRSLPPSSRAPRVSLAPKTPFPFPFKRLPRRLEWQRKILWGYLFLRKSSAVVAWPTFCSGGSWGAGSNPGSGALCIFSVFVFFSFIVCLPFALFPFILTTDPFLDSRHFCDNVFLDYLSLFIHNIGPKYDRETKLISYSISWKFLWKKPVS